MLRSKKAVDSRIELQKHNIQDTRVTVESSCSHGEKCKGKRWKAIRQWGISFLLRQAIIELWEHKLDLWNWTYAAIEKILEVFAS